MARVRLQKELRDLEDLPLVSVLVKEDYFKWRIEMKGPVGTPYEQKILCLRLEFPTDYPFRPFKMYSVDAQPKEQRLHSHPSLGWDAGFPAGFPESLLPFCGYTGEDWTPTINVRRVLVEWLSPQLTVCASQTEFLDYFKNDGAVGVFRERPESMRPELEPLPPGTQPVAVNQFGRTFEVGPFPAYATVYQLKRAVEAKEGIPSGSQRLLYGDRELREEWKLEDCNIYPSSSQSPEVTLLPRLTVECRTVKEGNEWLVELAEKDWDEFCRRAAEVLGEMRRLVLRLFLLLQQKRAKRADSAQPYHSPSWRTVTGSLSPFAAAGLIVTLHRCTEGKEERRLHGKREQGDPEPNPELPLCREVQLTGIRQLVTSFL
uniref:Ubiquitin-like domain-containing protein n=1 Tax=Chromera velia CCMP2878 TaxID=1169474 RepID=A0A0G4FJD8_9ALVE|eukprot:Cvel_17353.t1-p1 / transcript=Cvel_17353.t1 / gene=Cvel_17353 / organism=Chromera_velia_CCMP2878 / gene_product=Ubiquitin-conjugating enzyme E2 5B, putative / transcript_product=Ubiquitin-conjugating enzyme E2 5B, putative / location=Cvel_scaffold1379:3123-4667(+) / protein_length=373 / sequence_SO=supercontig / SO=protein_coding / is_pseudo=false